MMMLLDLLGSELAPIKILAMGIPPSRDRAKLESDVFSSRRDGMNATSRMIKNGVLIVKRRG